MATSLLTSLHLKTKNIEKTETNKTDTNKTDGHLTRLHLAGSKQRPDESFQVGLTFNLLVPKIC